LAYLLHIETSSPVCSVALSNDAVLLKEISSEKENDHASGLAILIQKVLSEAGIRIQNLSAVSVSAGPGSFTGLRIGVSTAKGICYALDIPLLAVSSLQSMAYAAKEISLAQLYCPMIDARRMEVYCALFDRNLTVIEKEDARIVEENIFRELLHSNKIIFFGSGAEKSKKTIQHQNAVFLEGNFQSAKYLVSLAYEKYFAHQFSHLVSFEPHYIKPFYTKQATG
jgi:tRNA threonylcarbamoyladenosine biosynthesis protein TsaB